MDPSAWQNPRCGGEEWGTALGGVDAAAGTRYLALRVRNCSDDTLDLPRPTFVGYDSDGAVIELTADVDPLPTLRPDDVITMEMTWGGNGRCERGVQELVITLGDQHLSPDDRCLQLSGEFAPERDADIRVHFVVDDDSELS